jgi:hypothetical protein
MPWFKRADGIWFRVLPQYQDLIESLRKDGWKEAEDTDPPDAPAREPGISSAAVPAPELLTPPTPERAVLPEPTPEKTPEKTPPARPAIRATAKRPGPKPGQKRSPRSIATRIPSRKA